MSLLMKQILNNLKNLNNRNRITTGYEYETGRIISGSKEYAKRINFGAMPNATQKTIAHGIDFSKASFISMECNFQNTSGYKISFGNYAVHPTSPSISVRAFTGNTTVGINTNGDMSSWTGFITVSYIKT